MNASCARNFVHCFLLLTALSSTVRRHLVGIACDALDLKRGSALQELMTKKEVLGKLLNKLRLIRQRATFEGWQSMGLTTSEEAVNDILAQLLLLLERLDEVIGALLRARAPPPHWRCVMAAS